MPGIDPQPTAYDQAMRDPWKTWFTRDYSFFTTVKRDMLLQAARRHIGNPSELDWLDVGCGQGELMRLARGCFRASLGCDPSAAMLAKCNGVEALLQEKNDCLPFPDESFDVVSLCCVLHHVPGEERTELLREVFRVLRPIGIVVIFEHNPWNIVTRLIVSRCAVDVGVTLVNPRKLRHDLVLAGLSPVSSRYYLFLPPILPFASVIERTLEWLPLGGQYMMVARRAVNERHD